MAIWHYVQKTNYRLLDIDPNDPGQGKAYLPFAVNIVYYVDIPDANNEVGVNYRVAAKDSRYSEELGKVPHAIVDLETKKADVYAKLQSGAAYEKTEPLRFSSAYLTDGQRDAEINARCAAMETLVIEEKQREWKYWGYAQTI